MPPDPNLGLSSTPNKQTLRKTDFIATLINFHTNYFRLIDLSGFCFVVGGYASFLITPFGLLMFAACMPYVVWADSSAAAASAAAASDGYGSSAAAAASASASASSSEPHRTIRCICNTHYAPVCGTDGYTYSNECMLRCVSNDNTKNSLSGIGMFYDGECETPYVCPQVHQPVCGTNNKTYNNECYLESENKIRNKNKLTDISIAYRAACQAPTCVCPDCIVPVCGTDGRTYKNICIMQCYSRIEQAKGRLPIKLHEANACKQEKCYCSSKKNELCASDETTYLNECVLQCQNRRRGQLGQNPLKIQYQNRCVKCSCTKKYNPVCGSNDFTFSNHCELLCENRRRDAAKRHLLFVRWAGRCDCGCSKAYYPVCASDRRTYQNICWLNCLNRKLKQDRKTKVDFVGYGVCQVRKP